MPARTADPPQPAYPLRNRAWPAAGGPPPCGGL